MKIYIFTYITDIEYVKDVLTKEYNIDIVTNISECDYILSVGGDGTLLAAGRLSIVNNNKPVVGYNSGTLGFLTCGKSIHKICESLLFNNFIVDEVRLLHIATNDYDNFAINEVVVSNHLRGKLVNIIVSIDDTDEVIEYSADSVIFSTQIGSTAYNLSAGGALVHPRVDCLLVTPVAPFSMSARPIVLPSSFVLKIKSPDHLSINVDGNYTTNLHKNEEFIIKYKNDKFDIIKLNDNFLNSIKSKLGWGNLIKH